MAQIINIGVGDLRAVGTVSVPGGIIGEGGDDFHFTDAQQRNVLEEGFAWLDKAETWDSTIGPGGPAGTVNFFVAVAHEIGHALGLGHTDDLPGPSIMDGTTIHPLTGPSATDRSLIQTIYPPLIAAGPLVVAGAGPGGGPEVRVFQNGLRYSFFAYDPTFTGGVRVATADLNGDGIPDVITAPGPGGGPDVRVYDGVTGSLLREFWAYDMHFTGGVRVAAGDVNGDGKADIIAGAGPGGGPNVTVFSGADGARQSSFFAFYPAFSNGVFVAAGDVNGDGHADIIAGADAGGGPDVAVFDGADGALLDSYFAFAAGFHGGVRVAVSVSDGTTQIVAAAGPGGGPDVRSNRGLSLSLADDYFAFEPQFSGGLYVAGNAR
jgi:hypothetical protein